MTSSESDKRQSVSFTVGPEMRDVRDEAVAALDNALTRVSDGELLHLIDPRRINAFSCGGPSTWSVAFVPVGTDHYFVTYGNSERVDPARAGVDFELSFRVPARSAGLWPGLLLRQLVRYMLMSGRELRCWDFLPLPHPITRITVDDTSSPMTDMDTVVLVPDPLVAEVVSPHGPIAIRRVVGIYPDERDLMHEWSVQGLTTVMRGWSPNLATDIERATLTKTRAFVEAMADGSREEGSQFGFVAVPGVRWEADGSAITITLPGGEAARRIDRMVRARLGHGRNLLIHDTDPNQMLAVALEPSETWGGIELQGDVVVLRLPPDAPLLVSLTDQQAAEIEWRFD